MWVRGLKRYYLHLYSRYNIVAPYVGAWIETQTTMNSTKYM